MSRTDLTVTHSLNHADILGEQMNLLTEFLAVAIAGVVAHRGFFIYGEWHMQAKAILFAHIAAYNVLCLTLMSIRHASISRAMSEASLLSALYLSSLFTSILVYRLWFHGLHEFPGPVLARSTKLWHAWKGRQSQNHLLLDQLHCQYGDFVRTGRLFRPTLILRSRLRRPERIDNLRRLSLPSCIWAPDQVYERCLV